MIRKSLRFSRISTPFCTSSCATAPAVVSEVKATLAREKQQYQQYHKELQLKKMALAQQMNFPDYNLLNIYDPLLEKDVFNKKTEIHNEYDILSVLAKNPLFLKYKSQLLELNIEDKSFRGRGQKTPKYGERSFPFISK